VSERAVIPTIPDGKQSSIDWEQSSLAFVVVRETYMWPGASPSNIVNAAAALTVAAIIVAALTLAREFLIPLAIAALFSFALQPLVRWLSDHWIPRPAAVALTVFALLTLLGATAGLLTREAAIFAEDLPRYEYNLRAKVRDVSSRLEGVGIWRTASAVLNRVGDDIKNRVGDKISPQATEPGAVKIEVEAKPTGPFSDILLYLRSSISPIASVGLALLFTFFILLQYHDLRDRIVRLMGSAEIGRSTQALNDAAGGLARFFRLQATLNFGFGIVIASCLWAIGIPNPLLWGALAAVLRFVPYIGGALSAILPLALAAAIEAGWGKLIVTAVMFGVAEFLVGHIIEPLLFGRKTRLSPLAVLLAAAFWSAIWGPIGLVLAVPVTLSLVVFAEHVPALSFLSILLGNQPALSPQQRMYHRLLAGDAAAAAEDVDQWLEDDKPLVEHLDGVAIPALAIAANDSARGVLRPEQLDRLKEAVHEFVMLAKELVELRLEDTPVQDPLTSLLIIPARGPFDQAAASLIALAARLDGQIDATCAASGGLLGISASASEPSTRDVECVALVSAGGASPSQLSLLVRRMRRAFPQSRLGALTSAGPDELLLTKAEREALVSLSESSRKLLGDVKAATPKASSSLAQDVRAPSNEPVGLVAGAAVGS
jgi:predicted PurR-regulated permease PerM